MSDDELAPTPVRVATARRLRRLHETFVGESRCRWCLHAWPCRTERWCALILRAAQREQTDGQVRANSPIRNGGKVAMSIRVVVGQLTDARNRLVQARQVGTYAATSISESRQLVDGVLDAVADKALSEAIAVHSRALLIEVRGIDVLCAGVDEAITRAQQVGGSRR